MLSAEKGKGMTRQVPIAVSLLVLASLMATPALAGVLYFDDIFTGGSNAAMPVGYGGFTWSSGGWAVESDTQYQGPDYFNTYGAVSSPNAAFNWNGPGTVTVTRGTPFTFNGAYFTTWASEDDFEYWSSTTITVEGYASSVLVGSVSMPLRANGYDWLDAFFGDWVDELRFHASADQTWWLMDNFTYEAGVIPEPASAALLGGGLLALGLAIRRLRRS